MGTRKSYAGGAVATRLAADISAGATTMTLDDASTYPSSANPFVIAINRGSSSEEKVLIGSRSGNILTVTSRGYDGTSAIAHVTNEVVEHVLDAVSIDEANSFVNLLTTRGDQVTYGASGPQRVAKGTSGQIWVMVDSNDPGWASVAAAVGTGGVSTAMLAAGAVTGAKITLARTRVTRSAAQSIAHNTNSVITWDTETYDTDTIHSTSVNTSRLTVPAGMGGVWMAFYTIEWGAAAAGSTGRAAWIQKNGGAQRDAYSLLYAALSVDVPVLSAAAPIVLAAGDYIECGVYQNSGGAINAATTATNSCFGMYWLGV